MTAKPPSFQDIILRLHRFWADQGCVILQPYDMEVGAGTFHPATTLRALGPKPWKAAYVQPSRRPADGRYGENPNRLQHYYQYQVILKPSPADPQALLIESYRALGIDPALHDIRFVEDDWESPTLGAWGLGWEVWCDGMEVTQFTYFQQVGGIACDKPSAELTYGLERLAMYIQGVENVYDLAFNGEGVKYGEVFLRADNTSSPFTKNYKKGQVITVPIAHHDGNYFADGDTLKSLEDNGQIAFRYSEADGQLTPESNPNGSQLNIAGIVNKQGNVLGMMPHPERHAESLLGGTDGAAIFRGLAA